MKSILKGFLSTILWIVAISALFISLFVMTNYNSGKADVSKNGARILEIEKKIEKLEERIEQLEENIEDLNYDIRNHIHWQYEKYPTRTDEYYFDRNRVRIKENPKYFGKNNI